MAVFLELAGHGAGQVLGRNWQIPLKFRTTWAKVDITALFSILNHACIHSHQPS
jgi:hypothetical protein